MNQIKGVLFDKDGTILNVNRLWVPVALSIADELAKTYGLSENDKSTILRDIGVIDGNIIMDSVLASGTAMDISKQIWSTLQQLGKDMPLDTLDPIIRSTINRSIKENVSLILPLGNLKHIFARLRDMGIKIGLATADMYDSTITCLRHLGVLDDFSFIGTEESTSTPKPNPDLLNQFCAKCGISPSQVAMVGDSQIDMEMAHNGSAAVAIAVVPTDLPAGAASLHANYLIRSIDEIIDHSGKLIWN